MERVVRHPTLIATPIAVALGLVLLNTRSASAAEGPRQVLKAGRTQVVVEPWNRGLSIAVDGVTVSRGSNVVVTTPPWTPHYYLGPSAPAVESATQGMIEGGTVLRIKHRGENDSFLGEETIAVTDGRVEQVFEGQFTKDEGEALIQWQIAGLDPTPIIGRPYKAKLTSGEVREGVVPVTAQSGDVGREPEHRRALGLPGQQHHDDPADQGQPDGLHVTDTVFQMTEGEGADGCGDIDQEDKLDGVGSLETHRLFGIDGGERNHRLDACLIEDDAKHEATHVGKQPGVMPGLAQPFKGGTETGNEVRRQWRRALAQEQEGWQTGNRE